MKNDLPGPCRNFTTRCQIPNFMNPNLEFHQLWSHGVKFPGFSLVCLERQDLESVILNSHLLLVAIPFKCFAMSKILLTSIVLSIHSSSYPSICLSVQPLYMHKWFGSSTIQLALSTFVRYGPSEKSPDASSLYGLSGDTLHTYAGHGDFQDSALFPGTLDWSQTHS